MEYSHDGCVLTVMLGLILEQGTVGLLDQKVPNMFKYPKVGPTKNVEGKNVIQTVRYYMYKFTVECTIIHVLV